MIEVYQLLSLLNLCGEGVVQNRRMWNKKYGCWERQSGTSELMFRKKRKKDVKCGTSVSSQPRIKDKS